MSTPDKSFIAVDPESGATYRFNETDWQEKKDRLLERYPKAEIMEYDSYNPEDVQENDSIFVTVGDGAYSFTPSEWQEKQEKLMARYPNAQVNRVRGVNYWEEKATAQEEAIKAKRAEMQAIPQDATELWGNNPDYLRNLNELEELEKAYKANPYAQMKEEQEKSSLRRLKETTEKDYADFMKEYEDVVYGGGGAPMSTLVGSSEDAMMEGFARSVGSAVRGEDLGRQEEFNVQKPLFDAALQNINDAYEILERPDQTERNGNAIVNVFKGIGEVYGSPEFWSRGMNKLVALNNGGNAAIEKINRKLQEPGESLTEEDIDKILTPAEKAYVFSLMEVANAEAQRAPIEGLPDEFNADRKVSKAYQIGQGIAEMTGYVAEFLLTGDITDAATAGATKAVQGWLVKNLMAKGGQTLGRKAARGLSKVAVNALTKTTSALMAAPVRTAAMGGTGGLGGAIAEQRTSLQEDGTFKGAVPSIFAGTYDTAVENFTEEMGPVITDLLGAPFKPLVKPIKDYLKGMDYADFGKLESMARKAGRLVSRSSSVAKGLAKAGYHGSVEEWGEEFLGAIIRGELDEFFDKDQQLVLLGTFAPLSLLGIGGTASHMIRSTKEVKAAAENLRVKLKEQGMDDKQAGYLADYFRKTSAQKMKDEFAPVIGRLQQQSELGEAFYTSDLYKSIARYIKAVAEYQTIDSQYKEQEAQQRVDKQAELEEKFGKFYNQSDNTVNVVQLKDGRLVYQVTDFATNGEAGAVDMKDGAATTFRAEDVQTYTDEEGNSHNQESGKMSLDSYLSSEIMRMKQSAQVARMRADRQKQIDALAKELPKTFDLGTKAEPLNVNVVSHDANGVKVEDANKNEMTLGWEKVGRLLNKPIHVLTDNEIAEAEAADMALRVEAVRSKNAQSPAEEIDVEAEIDATNEEVKSLQQKPEDAYTDKETGLVDEIAFWNNDPEGYCDWNDRQQNDGGIDSMKQIANAKAAIESVIKKAEKEAKTDNPVTRRTAEGIMLSAQEQYDRLSAIEQKYAEQRTSNEEKRAEEVIAMRERISFWRERLNLGDRLVVLESLDEVTNPLAKKAISLGRTEGWYDAKEKKVYLYMPDIATRKVLDKTIMHEVVTHYGLDNLLGEQEYARLTDMVWNIMSDTAKRSFYNYAGVNTISDPVLRRRRAAEEFIALVAEDVSFERANAEKRSIWQRIVDFFSKLFEKDELNLTAKEIAEVLDKNIKGLTVGNEQIVEEFKAEAASVQPEVSKSEADLHTEAVLNESGMSMMEDIEENVTAQAETMTTAAGAPVTSDTNDGTTMLSTATAKPWVDNLGNEHRGTMEMVLERMKEKGFSEQEVKQMEVKMQTAYDYMMKLQSLTNPDGSVRFEEFNAWAEKTPYYKQIGRNFVKAITSLVSNGDYPINLELTTDCIKREAFTMLLNELVKRGADLAGMGPAEIVTIQKMMKQYGIQVACALCFVEGKRLQIVNWASQIVNDWNDALAEAGVETDEMFEFGKDGDAFIPADEWRTYEDKPALAKALRTIDEVAKIFQGVDPKVYKEQKAKNEKALEKYIKEKEEAAAKKGKKWTPTDEQKREMKKIKVEGLTPTYVNENMKEYTAAFEEMRNEWVSKSPKKGPMRDPLAFTPTKAQWSELEKIRNRQIENVKQKMVRLIMEYPEMRKKMTLNDLLGSKGLMEIRQQHGAAYEQLYSIILQRFGTGTPKPVQDAVPYDGEVMTLTESAFKAANKIGGARLFSFSDFDITKVFDYMQMFFDLEANRQMLQSYTKEVAAILLFGKSNAKFNISTLASAVVPAEVMEEYESANDARRRELRHQWAENAGLIVDENGTITGINFSEEHSVSPEFAQQIFHDDSRNKDCGAIMVGASVNHAIFSAAQDWIRMVIPFHLSGMPIAARDKTDVKWWTDNTEYQSTRKRTKDGWSKIDKKEDTFEFYADMHQEGWNMRDKAREYIEWCKSNAFRPKFDWGINSDYYRAYCEENGYTPNQQIIDMMDADTTNGVWNQYYKFLTDFTAFKPVFNEEGEMIDEIPSPQQRVVSNFDMSEMEKQVIFEGENSMLARREGNIALANQHVSELADRVAPYLNGQITEEEMELRDDVFYDARKDANAYLDAKQKEAEGKDVRLKSNASQEAVDGVLGEQTTMFKTENNAAYSERGGAVSDNPSSTGLLQNDSAHQSPRSLVQSEDAAKLENNTFITKQSIQKFLNKGEFEKTLSNANEAVREVSKILKLSKSKSSMSFYGDFYEGDFDLDGKTVRIRVSTHPANGERIGNADVDNKISLVIYKDGEHVSSGEHRGYTEYVFHPSEISPRDAAMSIIHGVKSLLDGNGFEDSSKKAQMQSYPFTDENGNTMFKTFNRNQSIFVSNAAKAVEGINMGKAAPEQWLKTLEKNGGLKAGEDKWIGLSEWLKSTDKKSVTKQELLDFINENAIKIEEVHYGDNGMHNDTLWYMYEGTEEYEKAYQEQLEMDAKKFAEDMLQYKKEQMSPEEYQSQYEDYVETYKEDPIWQSSTRSHVMANWRNNILPNMNVPKPTEEVRKRYRTEGLENNHEIALVVPTVEQWHPADRTHFGDAGSGRAVVWARFGDAIASDGRRVLVVDEVQSDRHQQGRTKGYSSKETKAELDTQLDALKVKETALLDFTEAMAQKYPDAVVSDIFTDKGEFSEEDRAEALRLKAEYKDEQMRVQSIMDAQKKLVPEAPFEKNWAELGMKRVLRYAAENGYDAVAWTKGEQQEDRYSLDKSVNSIRVGEWAEDSRLISIDMKRGYPSTFSVNRSGEIKSGILKGKALSEVLGKEMANIILSKEGEAVIEGEELRTGNEGLKSFYNHTLPAFMNKYGKKWGVHVEDITLPNVEEAGRVMHSVPVTEEMRESVMEGQTMFKTSPHQSSLEEITDMFYAWNQDDSLRPLFRKAYDFCNEIDLDVKFVSEEEMARLEGKGEGEQGARGINWGKKIRLNSDVFANIPDQLKASIILHEMIHAATNYILVQNEERLEYENHREAKRELEAIFEEIKNKFPDQYGSTDVNEMVAEMAKPEFRDVMKQGTWWERFLNAIRRLLGISEKDYDRLTPTLAWVYELMDNPSFELFEEAKPNSEEYTLFKTAITPEVRKEMDQIAAQAMVNGNYLLAPNGKETKLTPEQWALVRTKNFKRWFGDWTKITRNEDGTWNIPEGVSHVIDQETGEPMVMHHGSAWEPLMEPKGKAVFRMNDGLLGKGAYFSNVLAEATLYAEIATGLDTTEEGNYELLQDKYVTDYFLNVRNEEDIYREGDDMVVVAKSPNQIKSATENSGEYSESEDIRFSTKEAVVANTTEDNLPLTRKGALDRLEVLRKQASEANEDKLPYFVNDETGIKVFVSNADARHTMMYHNEDQVKVIGIYDKLIAKARFLKFDEVDESEAETLEEVRKYACPVIIDGKQYVADMTIKKYRIGNYVLGETHLYDTKLKDDNSAPDASFQKELPILNSQLSSSEDKDTNNSDTNNTSEEKDFLFKTRTKPAPIKTQEVYKLMRLGADGKLYPLFIGSAEPIELGTWYDAESPNLGDLTKLASGVHLVNNDTGKAMTLDEFKAKHPEIAIKGKRPNVAAINWATENGARWIEIEDKATAQRRYEGESRSYYNLGINGSGQVGQFAMRPGWHAGSLPTMRQIGKGKDKNLRDDSFVWVKGRIPADVDYQSEADANPDKDIPTHIPTDGFYMKATNANAKASQADKMGWYVAGSFIADEIISDAEARSVIDSWNAEHPNAKVEYDFARESGREFDPARGGLVESEEDIRFSTSARDKSIDEIVMEGKQKVSSENTQAVDAFMDRIRRINGNLQQLRMAAAAQREYDQKTVKTITDIANDLLEGGALNDVTRGEIKRLLSIVNGGVGKNDLTKSVDRLMDLMVANQLRYGKSLIEKFLKIRGSKVDQRGVEVRGKLDIPGQQMLAAFKDGIGVSKDALANKIAEAEDALDSDSETKRRNAENELVGLYLALQYQEDINDSVEEEKSLRDEIKKADEDYEAGIITKQMHRQLLGTIYEAILENRIQRVNAYEKLASDLGTKLVSSIKNAGILRDAEKERIQKIQHYANSDMKGMPADMHEVKESKFWNRSLVRFLLKPLATFDQMLRAFAPKSTSGEGYLWNHFMGGWLRATENEYKGVQKVHETLDEAARSMFGEGVQKWSDLFEKERKMPKLTIAVWDDNKMVEKEISQGNALYIYMVNKMTDGKMKLRKMGISQEDVDAIVAQMDRRFIALADWMQEQFLPSIRDKYNAVHERLFGAPMASIDNYFPIKVNARARTRDVDVEAGEGTAKPATITGSIIKRTRNSLALDIMNADAFDVMLEHIQQMEHWAAFAEFNKDLNTLLSYRKFRNRVENMSGIYGSGKTVWNNFKTVAEIAAGVYQPASKSDSLDKAAMNLAKGVTGAKIAFRVYTAIKQLLSMPAFVSDANILSLGKNMAKPWAAWNWAMENLPMFEKRWKSRQAGDTRLMATESDWGLWKTRIVEIASRYGMTPNAFIDAVTVSIGAKSIYETKYKEYLKMGYSEEQADKKAKRDATVLFNESQQSNESAFLSAVQIDRTVASVAFTVFRNSAMGYQRMAVDALRNLSQMTQKGYKEEAIEYMKKQMVRDGLTEEQAERAAQRIYSRSFAKSAARLATFSFLVQFAWNLGAYLPYLLVGDDDDEKKAMIKDAAVRGLVGGTIEGLAGGNIVSNMAGNLAMGEKLSEASTTLLPVVSDIEKVIKMLDYDKVAAYNEIFNLVVQSVIGVNPQTVTDIIVGIDDACNGDPETSKEVALCIMRMLQVPQSQIEKVYMDEIDFTVDKGLDLTIEQLAKRYADYKVNRGAPLTGWMYEDAVEKEREDKYIKRFLKTAEELKRSRGNEEAKKYYEYLDTDYKEVTETISELRRNAEAAAMKGDQMGAMEYASMLNDFMKTDIFKEYTKFGGKAKAIEAIRDKMKKVDMQTREALEDMMLQLRKEMVEEMEQAKAETDAND